MSINQSINLFIKTKGRKITSIRPNKGSLACDGGRLNITSVNIEENQQKTKQWHKCLWSKINVSLIKIMYYWKQEFSSPVPCSSSRFCMRKAKLVNIYLNTINITIINGKSRCVVTCLPKTLWPWMQGEEKKT